ncbi:MAG: ROK family protein [Acidobacteria bacterium]|nr:ROK family protein [Acidobacteriota bacterium]
MTEFGIGVDLGGTNLRAAAIDRDGNLLDKPINVDTNYLGGREAVIGDIVAAVNRLKVQFEGSRLAGVGIGVPGFIRLREGFITNSNNLPYLENFPVRDDIERRLGTPIILENDANAAALGETWMGAGKEVDDLVLLTLGTGVGGGIILDGKVLHGALGMAGELGHLTIDPNGPPCGCGNNGCLEKIASATAVESMAYLMSLGDNLTSRDVYHLAAGGNIKAQRIFQQMGRALGIAIANLINTFNFPLYLLSGGMLPAWDYFAPSMLEEVSRRSFTYRNSQTRIEQAKLGNLAGLYGAAYLPLQNQALHSR